MHLVTHMLNSNVTTDSPDWLQVQRGHAQSITGPFLSLPHHLLIQDTTSLQQWSPTFATPRTGAPINI